ncbi:uncharacterized protein LOC124677665 [Lolium rigidum]|uniref:uncharacterized protein LOC124677665 n=1 Tax=Lolium rigidum TaxID=89674 RepID=UPI001F5D7A78|nr:uncharacterized protein LOC124677665 [Lolium rigidum]
MHVRNYSLCRPEHEVIALQFKRILFRIEVRSPAIGEAIALGAAVDYLSQFGMLRIHEYEESGNNLYGSASLRFFIQKELGMYLYETYPCETRYEFNEANQFLGYYGLDEDELIR